MCESRRHASLIPESKTWRWKSWVRIAKLRLVSLWFQWQVIFPEKYSYFFSFNFILVLKMFSSLHFIKESHQTLAWYRISSSVKLNCCNISPKCQWEIQEFILKNQTVSGWGFMMHVKIVVVRGAATPWIVRLRLDEGWIRQHLHVFSDSVLLATSRCCQSGSTRRHHDNSKEQ